MYSISCVKCEFYCHPPGSALVQLKKNKRTNVFIRLCIYITHPYKTENKILFRDFRCMRSLVRICRSWSCCVTPLNGKQLREVQSGPTATQQRSSYFICAIFNNTVYTWHYIGPTKRRHYGGPGSNPGLVMWDLWRTKWRWGKFSPSTSVSTANLYSTNFSTITITYHPGLLQ
jgi:hypothetical protein